MNLNNLAVIILAAGRGVRFGEKYSKLLHPVLGKPLIYYPIQNLKNLGVENIIAVVSDSKVEKEISKYIDCKFVYQEDLTGTADAVKLALPEIPSQISTLMILNGDDATLYSEETLQEFLKSHISLKSPISLMTLKTQRDIQVGRIIRDSKNNFSEILEHKEYLDSGAKTNEINSGVYLINMDFARTNLPSIPKNPNGEYYLTDLLNIAKENGKKINLYVLKNHSEWIGINDKKDLKYAESIIKKRIIDANQKGKNLKVHFLGIAGSGTSAAAKLAEFSGFKVTGCDSNLSGEFADILGDIETFEGHSAGHLENVDILAITPAILSLDPNNQELEQARKRGIKIMTWQKFAGIYLTEGKTVIAICGTHGKSTTTAMVAEMLEDGGKDPMVLLGATLGEEKLNYRLGQGNYFVIEADEFNDNYLNFKPDYSIVTNIEFDHPEFFKDLDSYKTSFQNFLHETKTLILANLEDENSEEVLKEKEIADENFFPPVIDYSKNIIDFPLTIFGGQNVLNASAAYNLGLNLEIEKEVIKKSLQNFKGVSRRSEFLGEKNGARIYSDFGHHPTEIKVTVEEFKKYFPGKKIWLIYQPHMFTRTKALFREFVEVFKNIKADGAFIIDIYPSREIDTGQVSSGQLVDAVGRDNVKYFGNLEKAFDEMESCFTPDSIVLFMGAGDIDTRVRDLLK